MGIEDDFKLPGAATGLKTPDGIVSNIERIGNQNDRIVSQLHGKMYEQTQRLNMFFAANQAAQAVSVALTTTYTGLCLSNPAGNTKNLVPRQVSIGVSVHQVALAAMGIQGGYVLAGVVTHTAVLTPYSCMLGNGQSATGKADSQCTTVGTPLVIMPFVSTDIITTGTPNKGGGVVDLDGSIIIPPGAWVAIYALTAITGLFGITWEEVPV